MSDLNTYRVTVRHCAVDDTWDKHHTVEAFTATDAKTQVQLMMDVLVPPHRTTGQPLWITPQVVKVEPEGTDSELKEWLDYIMEDAAKHSSGYGPNGPSMEAGILRTHLMALRDLGRKVLYERKERTHE